MSWYRKIKGNSQQKEILIEHDTQIEISDISLSRDTNSGDKYDLITNNKSPVLVAMTDPGATVQVYINGVLQGTVEASSSGNISYTMPANTPTASIRCNLLLRILLVTGLSLRLQP